MAHWRKIIAQLRCLLANDFERRGMSREEARLAARRAYGGVEQAKQAWPIPSAAAPAKSASAWLSALSGET